MDFKVGNKVKVIDKLYTYSTYETWINKYAMQYKKEWNRKENPYKNNEYIIRVKAPHGLFNIDLYLIQDIKTKQVYIIESKGLELVIENKKFFKKLPNDYTGTIEVENGYIVEREILDKEEKEYLSAVVRPFKNRISHISKVAWYDGTYYISIELDNYEIINLPYFEKEAMYNGMEEDKKYTLKELGLDE